jgi:tetratricopeptide (TPR) repeat protein
LALGTVYHRRGASSVLAGEAVARAERLAEPMDAALRVPASLGRTLGGRYDLEFRGDAARVLGRAQRGALQPTTALGRVSPFVGRPPARTRLDTAWADTLATRRGGLWQVLGPAGVGKTRLVVEWLATLGHTQGAAPRVATGAARVGPDADIYGPYPDLLRALAKVAPDDPPEVAAVKVQILVRRSAFELTRAPTPAEVDTESAVLRLLGLENAQNTEDPAPPSHSPGAVEPGGRTTLFVALSTLFLALARRRPLVLIVDDADALSPAALGLTSHLAGRLAETPAMLVLIARTRPALPPTEAPVAELPVTPLDAPDASALVAHLLARLPHVPRRLAAWFGAHGAGLPGHIEALAADLVESGALTPGDAEWILDDARPLPDVPQALEARASARLERCDEPEREALAAMSLAGPRTWRPVLAAILGDSGANHLPATLERLQARDLIRPSPDTAAFGGAALRLAEPVLGALALAAWPAERRRGAHRRCAEILDTAPRGLEGRDALLAHHWAEAGETTLAATHRLRAATQAIRTHAHEQAADLLEASLTGVDPAERLGVTVDLAEQCLLAGRMQRAVEVAEAAPSGDLAGAPTALRLRLSLCHARALERLGRYAEAQTVCRGTRTWFTPGPGTQALEVLLTAAEAGVARKLGEPTRAVALLAPLLGAPAMDTDPEYEAALGVACRVSGNASLQLRDFEAAEHAFLRAESTAALLRNPVAVLDARIGLGALAWYRGAARGRDHRLARGPERRGRSRPAPAEGHPAQQSGRGRDEPVRAGGRAAHPRARRGAAGRPAQ